MKRAEVRALVKQLAEAWKLRYAALTKSHIGICRGTNVCMMEYDGFVSLEFIAPGASLDEQFELKFAGFENFLELGLNPEILRAVAHREGCFRDRVTFHLDGSQLAKVGMERMQKIPDAIASDMVRFGAATSFTCARCQAEAAVMTMLVNYGLTNYCEACRKQVELHTIGGKFSFDPQVKWRNGLIVLAISCLLLGWGWGYAQSPELMAQGVPYVFVFSPIVCGFLVSWVVHRAAGQSDALLRLLIILGSLLAVLGGNITRTQAILAREQAHFSWWEAAYAYFRVFLLYDFRIEWLFLFPAPLGAWLRNRREKAKQEIRIS